MAEVRVKKTPKLQTATNERAWEQLIGRNILHLSDEYQKT